MLEECKARDRHICIQAHYDAHILQKGFSSATEIFDSFFIFRFQNVPLSLSLSGLAPCRLTEMPSKHDSNGIRRKSR